MNFSDEAITKLRQVDMFKMKAVRKLNPTIIICNVYIEEEGGIINTLI